MQRHNFDSSLGYRNDSAVESDLTERNLSTRGSISNENASARNNEPTKKLTHQPSHVVFSFDESEETDN